MLKAIKVLFVAAELSPLAKVGGLADVVGALPKSLYDLGVDVRIVIPKYGIIDEKKYSLKKIVSDINVPFKGKTEKISVYSCLLPGSQVTIYFINHDGYLGHNGIYFQNDASSIGTNREAERFVFFSRSSLEFFKKLNWQPDIIHCHDWHVGMTPVLLKILGKNQTELKKIKTLLTIHNLEYQGRYNAMEIFKMLGLKQDDWPTLSQQRHGDIISLQQAILTSDHLNTVSPAYAREILTPEYNAGLAGSLTKRKNDLTGILNGIDVEKFNPATDPDIISNYTPTDISGKEK
jgi:starch synthase